jgi:hypothetical protein
MFRNSAGSFCSTFIIAAGLTVIGLPSQLRADSAPADADKGEYNLFNVTPAIQLRPLVLDANDGVADPTTVDAGYAEVQGSLVDYYHGSRTYGPVNYSKDHFEWSPRVSLGVLNNVDVFIHPGFQVTSYKYSGAYNASGDSSGYTGINIGAKINLWGNDGGMTALAIAPYISIPNGADTVLGGADIPFAVRLPCQFYLKFVFNPYAFENGSTVYFGMDNSMSLHKMFGKSLDTYAYLDTIYLSDSTPWYGYAGFGAGYLITPNIELFAGIGFGLTDNSYDYNPRLGLAWRF